jgi:hypothetical protein
VPRREAAVAAVRLAKPPANGTELAPPLPRETPPRSRSAAPPDTEASDHSKENPTMPQAWSNKDERQYEHIKESAQKRGKSTSRAKEIAARTVNKERREEGRTKSGRKTTSGTGNPTHRLEDRSKQELYNRAKQLGVNGRSTMNKSELVRAIRKAS